MDSTLSPVSDAGGLLQWQPATITTGLTNTPVLVFGRAGNIYGWVFENPNNATMYIQFFDKALANQVTIGTTVPDFVLPVGAAGFTDDLLPMIIRHFYKGCVIAATTTENGAVAPGSVIKVPTIHYR